MSFFNAQGKICKHRHALILCSQPNVEVKRIKKIIKKGAIAETTHVHSFLNLKAMLFISHFLSYPDN